MVVAEANLRCGDFLSEKSCRHSTVSFSFFLVLTTRYSLSFHKFERQSCLFLGLISHFHLLMLPGNAYLLISVFFCGIKSFYVSISDAVFLVTSFPIFDHSVWMILSF